MTLKQKFIDYQTKSKNIIYKFIMIYFLYIKHFLKISSYHYRDLNQKIIQAHDQIYLQNTNQNGLNVSYETFLTSYLQSSRSA